MLQAMLLPVFVQIALTFVLLFWMGRARVGSIRRGDTKIADVALGQPGWPVKVQQISNCYHNQFQLPLLFYVLTVLIIVTHQADVLFVVLAWLFVGSRLAHAYVHTGTNYVPRRFNIFVVGFFILLAMWLIFAVRIVLGLP